MGRIKTSFIKHLGKDIFEQHEDKFSTDFDENKKITDQYVHMKSKKFRNILAGYVTSLKKQQRG